MTVGEIPAEESAKEERLSFKIKTEFRGQRSLCLHFLPNLDARFVLFTSRHFLVILAEKNILTKILGPQSLTPVLVSAVHLLSADPLPSSSAATF